MSMLPTPTLLYNASEEQWRLYHMRQYLMGNEDVLADANAIVRVDCLIDLLSDQRFVMPNGAVTSRFGQLMGLEAWFSIDFDEQHSLSLGADTEVYRDYRTGGTEVYREGDESVDIPTQIPSFCIHFQLCFSHKSNNKSHSVILDSFYAI